MNKDLNKMIEELRKKKAVASLGGGLKNIERQHEAGRLTARERIACLLDPSTFEEMNMLAALPDDSIQGLYGDGVVVGYGKIGGR
jgi:propionyl-CoA carboxylase beta chain